MLAAMSFSFQARGTREECIKSLNSSSHHELSADGQVARGLVLAFLADAPASGSMLEPFTYEITGYGHHDPHRGSAPSLDMRLTVIPPAEEGEDIAEDGAEAAVGM